MRAALTALLIAAVACLGSAPAGAAPFVMRLGPDRLVLDTPPGFADTAAFSSPRLAEVAETLTDASNRVLLFGLTDADARRFTVGDSLDLRRYVLVATPRAAERSRVTTQEIAAIHKEAMRNLAEAPPAGDYMQYLQGRTAGQAHLLALIRQDAQVLSLLQGTMLPRPQSRDDRPVPPVFRLSTTTIALIAGKALYLSVFSDFESPADLAWMRSVTERWIEELQRLNR